MDTRESWRSVVSFTGYDVSSEGRVRSWRQRGGRTRTTPELRRFGSSDGYATVQLMRDCRACTRLVHVLVLEAFVGPRPLGLFAAHLDGDRANNAASNLTWATRAENEAHKEGHGTRLRGEAAPGAKLTTVEVHEIRQHAAANADSFEGLGRRYGVSGSQIGHIVRGEQWRTC